MKKLLAIGLLMTFLLVGIATAYEPPFSEGPQAERQNQMCELAPANLIAHNNPQGTMCGAKEQFGYMDEVPFGDYAPWGDYAPYYPLGKTLQKGLTE